MLVSGPALGITGGSDHNLLPQSSIIRVKGLLIAHGKQGRWLEKTEVWSGLTKFCATGGVCQEILSKCKAVYVEEMRRLLMRHTIME